MRALIAMSGGVDSSAAAQIMKDRGFDCVGCTMKLFDPAASDSIMPPGSKDGVTSPEAKDGAAYPGSKDGAAYPGSKDGATYPESKDGATYPGSKDGAAYPGAKDGAAYPGSKDGVTPEEKTDAIEEARGVTQKIGIPYHIFHCEKEFRESVILPFIESYENGRTPNPCLECNRCLKFGGLYEKMKELGCDCLVTGHYARVSFDEAGGRWLLHKAAHPDKDQSYFLYTLTQEQLAHVQFPMGDITKEEAREVAEQAGFHNAKRKDSQDICFVPDGDYAGFIERYSGKIYPPGDFTDAGGNVLGRHKGIIYYTLGQRRGLGIPAASRLYVTGIDPAQNRVILGRNADLFGRELTVRRVNLIALPRIEGELRCKVKIRSRHREQPAVVTQTGADTLRVVFDEPQRAITPGQAAVLYDEDVVIGGGIITAK